MSLDATLWVWKIQNIKSSEKLVLLSMADRSGEDHTCWPCLERISKDTCLNIKTVKSVIKRLKESGYIRDTDRRVGHKNRTVVYQLVGINGREENKEPENGPNTKEPENGPIKDLIDPNLDSNRPKIGEFKRPKIGPQNLPPLESPIEPNPPIPPTADLPESDLVSDAEIVISHLNKITGKNFRPSDENLKNANARLNEKYSVDELLLVAEHKTMMWMNDPKMREFLRPQTLFSKKFDSYLQTATEWNLSGRNHATNRQESSYERSIRECKEVQAQLLREIAEEEQYQQAIAGGYCENLAAND